MSIRARRGDTNGEVPGAGTGAGVIWRALYELVLAQTAGVTCKICLKMGGVKIDSRDCSLVFTRPEF